MSAENGASRTSPPPKGGGMTSLYANLLDPSASDTSATISRAPVVFKQPSASEEAPPEDPAAAAKQKALNIASALRFQPTKRPQLPSKSKPKAPIPKPPTISSATAPPPPPPPAVDAADTNSSSTTAVTSSLQAPKSTLADWTAGRDDEDVNGFYEPGKRQRGGRKRRKKNKDMEVIPQNWDDIYDPARPNNYEDYKKSEEKIREVREWKDRLYAHRIAVRRSHTSDMDSDDDDDDEYRRPMNAQFAPPPMNFAPPSYDEPTSTIPDDATGDDAYARRLQMSQQQAPSQSLTPPPPDRMPSPPPPPPSSSTPLDSSTISRAPVRYNLPPPPPEIPANETELSARLAEDDSDETQDKEQSGQEPAPRSNRPGQANFAARLLSKYGWTEGSGLGATGTGILDPLRVEVEKRKKKPDSEGGGYATPGGRGKIIGSKKGDGGHSAEAQEGRFGEMSEVIVLRGMLRGLDIDMEMEGGEDGSGGLMQEIGEECAEKYGRVERVFIDRTGTTSDHATDPPVFVKFTSPLSALRAVNALEGRIFNGNAITARFYDNDRFERGIYT